MNASSALKSARAAGGELALDGENRALKAASAPPAAVLGALSRHKTEVDTSVSVKERDEGLTAAPHAGNDPATVTAPGVQAECALAETHWRSAQAIGTLAVYEDHLARFPNCPFATLAVTRIDALKQ
jgi:hypothetical protein